jgi:hypothetical protein
VLLQVFAHSRVFTCPSCRVDDLRLPHLEAGKSAFANFLVTLHPLTPRHPNASLQSSFLSQLIRIALVIASLFAFVVFSAIAAVALAFTMAELPEGRQHCGPSKLRNVQQAPDSDTVVPETQLKADQYGIEYEDLDDEDLAVLARNSVKKPAGSTATSGQAPTAPFQTAPFVRPGTAKIEEPKIWSRQAPNKTLPKEGASAVKSPVHPDTVVPSVEPPAQEIPHQGKKAMTTYAHKLTSPKMIKRARYPHPGYNHRWAWNAFPKHRLQKSELRRIRVRISKCMKSLQLLNCIASPLSK